MNYTDNYQLNQWEAADRVLMSNFNEDNAKIDAALLAAKEEAAKALAEYKTSNDAAMNQKAGTEAITALENKIALCGNCKIVTGSYTGTGTYGSGSPTKLSFDFQPIMVLLDTGRTDPYNSIPRYYILMRPAVQMGFNLNASGTVTWTDSSVSWYNTSASTQINESGTSYSYIAIGI